jgi:ElaA protein
MDDGRIAAPLAAADIQRAIAWRFAPMHELRPHELYAALALRQQVFVVEQRCAFLDADGLDSRAWHLLGWQAAASQPALAAYLRIVEPGAKYREPSLGRIVTCAAARGSGIGRLLVAEGIAHAEALYPGLPIRIGAQRYLERFYASFGFRTVSDPYDEDGIEHAEMLRDGNRRLR